MFLKHYWSRTIVLSALLIHCSTSSAANFYVSPSGGNVLPFADWSSAATNIQDAIDAASAGDVVWVTNGIYSSGGKVMAGDLTNRVVLDKAVTVQSMNGPTLTVIQGAIATNGPAAVRCAWLTNGAVLTGFTVQGGATRTSGDIYALGSGGGVWCASTNATVANCMIITNAANAYGGGLYQGSLYNSLVRGNSAILGGSGSASSTLGNCTVVGNSRSPAVNLGQLTNCILFSNSSGDGSASTFSYCCTASLRPGIGNIGADPQFLPDGFHLANGSPCRAAGTNVVTGTDLDGQPWSDPPPIGCDQWQPSPLIPISPKVLLTADPIGFAMTCLVAGEEPFTCWWLRDGTIINDDGHYAYTHTTNVVATGLNPLDIGAYRVVVSNAYGMATSAVTRLVGHFVDNSASGPLSPFSNWATAATNIQDAIDAALAGEIVFVTNGIYATGGKSVDGTITNRVAIDKALTLQSVNGAAVTTIEGLWDPATNGPSAVRCVSLTNGAVLGGFTIRGGATRTGYSGFATYGGGVFGAGTNTTAANCIITRNSAFYAGAGAYKVTLINCRVEANRSVGDGVNGSSGGDGGGASLCSLRNCIITGNFAHGNGGGANYSTLTNCAIARNWALLNGGGTYFGTLVSCTVADNLAGYSQPYGTGGGTYYGALTNCIVVRNLALNPSSSNYYNSTFSFCCASPLPAGPGNISVDPQLLSDGTHLLVSSPCRAAGTAAVITGTDIDGQPWANPPSIGCDEWLPAPVIGSQPHAETTVPPLALRLTGIIVAGQEPFAYSWSKGGALLDDNSHYSSSHTSNLCVNGFGPPDAGDYRVVISNIFGSATSSVISIVIHCVDANATAPLPPYADWPTAATNIQDAIDAGSSGDFVLVTNGVYSNGGRVMAGDLTNRVAVTKPLIVTSVNGSDVTVIQGAWDPGSTNGPMATRCAWLIDGATLSGFTLRGGATRSTGDLGLQNGGAVYASSTNSTLTYCVLSNNSAAYGGGGAYQALISNSKILANRALYGGGAYQSILRNSYMAANSCSQDGAAVHSGNLMNCTVLGNTPPFFSWAVYNSKALNSIIYYNFDSMFHEHDWGPSYSAGNFSYCCAPGLFGSGNITNDPLVLSGIYLSSISPCRGAGNASYVSGSDIDGEPWMNPPAMGCDELWEAALTNTLSVTLTSTWPAIVRGEYLSLSAHLTGRPSHIEWSFGDGVVWTNVTYLGTIYSWTNIGDYTVTFTAFNAGNPNGVSTNLLVHVIPLVPPTLSISGLNAHSFGMSFESQPGVTYILEQTTNFTPPAVWRTVTYVYGTGGVLGATDSQATDGIRFYRLRIQ